MGTIAYMSTVIPVTNAGTVAEMGTVVKVSNKGMVTKDTAAATKGKFTMGIVTKDLILEPMYLNWNIVLTFCSLVVA